MRDRCQLSFPRPPHPRVLARLTSLTQIGELARRLSYEILFGTTTCLFSHILLQIENPRTPTEPGKPVQSSTYSSQVTMCTPVSKLNIWTAHITYSLYLICCMLSVLLICALKYKKYNILDYLEKGKLRKVTKNNKNK